MTLCTTTYATTCSITLLHSAPSRCPHMPAFTGVLWLLSTSLRRTTAADSLQVGTDISAHDVVGRLIHVYWPAEDAYFLATVANYDPATRQHFVEYNDGDTEHLQLHSERVRVQLGACERLHSHGWQPGDVVWATSGKACPPWPALVVTSLDVADAGSSSNRRGVPVQFFGSHELALVSAPERLEDGLGSGMHVCRSARYASAFDQALYELRCYLKVLAGHVLVVFHQHMMTHTGRHAARSTGPVPS